MSTDVSLLVIIQQRILRVMVLTLQQILENGIDQDVALAGVQIGDRMGQNGSSRCSVVSDEILMTTTYFLRIAFFRTPTLHCLRSIH